MPLVLQVFGYVRKYRTNKEINLLMALKEKSVSPQSLEYILSGR